MTDPNKEWLLQTSSPRVAGPWIKENSGNSFRKDPYGHVVVSIWSIDGCFYWSTSLHKNFVSGRCSYLQEAQDYADRHLTKEGWILAK